MRTLDFDSIFRSHGGDVLRWTEKLGVPARHVKDVAQEVLLRVYLSLDRYHPERPLRPWLFAITFHTVRDYLALASHREEPADTLAIADGLPDPACTSPDDELLRKRACEIADEVLGTMPEDVRRAFLLDLEDMSRQQIAVTLGVTEGKASRLIERARRSFRKAIARRRAAGALGVAWLVDGLRTEAMRSTDPEMASDAGAGTWDGVAPSSSSGDGQGPIAQGSRLSTVTGAGSIAAGAFVLGVLAAPGIHRFMSLPTAVDVVPEHVVTVSSSLAVVAPKPPEPAEPSLWPPSDAQQAAAAATGGVSMVRAEKLLFARAQNAFNIGDFEEALRLLDEHRRAYPNGWFHEEREMLIARARQRAARM